MGALAVAATGAAGSRPPAARVHPGCPPPDSQAIARGTLLVVFRPRPSASHALAPRRRVGACMIRTGIRMTLLRAVPHPRLGDELGGGIGAIAIAGPIVAYVVHHQTGVDTSYSELIVANAATRKILRSAPVGRSVDVLGEGLTALVVSSDGAVAWIVEKRNGNAAPEALSVHAAAAIGPALTLDEGPDIGPESLTLSHGTLSWWRSGVRRSAPLP